MYRSVVFATATAKRAAFLPHRSYGFHRTSSSMSSGFRNRSSDVVLYFIRHGMSLQYLKGRAAVSVFGGICRHMLDKPAEVLARNTLMVFQSRSPLGKSVRVLTFDTGHTHQCL
jgi:hypothetical protein